MHARPAGGGARGAKKPETRKNEKRVAGACANSAPFNWAGAKRGVCLCVRAFLFLFFVQCFFLAIRKTPYLGFLGVRKDLAPKQTWTHEGSYK